MYNWDSVKFAQSLPNNKTDIYHSFENESKHNTINESCLAQQNSPKFSLNLLITKIEIKIWNIISTCYITLKHI